MSGRRRGTPFVLSAPSGAGKTTVCRAVVASDPRVVLSVSHTTRAPRPGERDGVQYHFVSDARFDELLAANAFLEHADYSGHRYGTSWASLDVPLARGEDVLLEIETQGARQVRERRADAHLIFLLPPSLAALEQRLRGRDTEASDEIARRLEIARAEFGAAALFDSFVVNDEADRAAREVLEIIEGVRAGAVEQVRARFSRAAAAARLDETLAAWVAG